MAFYKAELPAPSPNGFEFRDVQLPDLLPIKTRKLNLPCYLTQNLWGRSGGSITLPRIFMRNWTNIWTRHSDYSFFNDSCYYTRTAIWNIRCNINLACSIGDKYPIYIHTIASIVELIRDVEPQSKRICKSQKDFEKITMHHICHSYIKLLILSKSSNKS